MQILDCRFWTLSKWRSTTRCNPHCQRPVENNTASEIVGREANSFPYSSAKPASEDLSLYSAENQAASRSLPSSAAIISQPATSFSRLFLSRNSSAFRMRSHKVRQRGWEFE